MHILITGAARGLGREIAIALSRAGHSIAVNYHRSEKEALELAKSLKNVVKEVVGSCVPLGITFEGLKPKEAIAAINSGKFDSEFSEPL